MAPQLGDVLNIAGALIKGSEGTFGFDLFGDDFGFNTVYTLIGFGATDGFEPADFSEPEFFGITPVFSFDDDGNLTISYRGGEEGDTIDNRPPILTPTNANFVVSGSAHTSGGVNIINSLLFQNGGHLLVNDHLYLVSGYVTVISGTASIEGDGPLDGPNGLAKSGSGTLVTTGNLVSDDETRIEEGTLVVNGTLQSPGGVAILGSGKLGGNGTIYGSVVNGGVLSPGNSPGTLVIDGDYTQTKDGTYQLEVAGKENHDRILVSGMARLAGTLDVIPIDGYQLEYGQKFVFIRARKVRGAFDDINLSDGFRGRMLVGKGKGILLVAPESYTLVASTENHRSIARALDSFIGAKGDRDEVSAALDELKAHEYADAFRQIAPTFYESLANVTIEQSNQQGQLLQQRFGAVRFGGVGSRGFSQIGMELPIVAEKRTGKNAKDIMEISAENRWGVWAQAYGIFGSMKSVDDVRSFDSDSGGFLLGIDYRWSDRFVAGFYTGYQGSKNRHDGGGHTEINAARFGAYATFDSGTGFYANGVLGGGFSDYNSRRTIEFGSLNRVARSNPKGGEFTAMLGSGYDWTMGGFVFGPTASAQYTYVNINGFEESGAGALNLRLNNLEAHSLRSSLGVRIAYPWQIAGGAILTPELRASWQHEFLNDSRLLTGSLDAGGSPGFFYTTTAPGRDSFYGSVGVNLQFGVRWSTNLFYHLNAGNGRYRSHMVTGGLNVSF